MSENTGGSSKRRKIVSATLAVAMAATMLLSGTLAYFYRSAITNTFFNTGKDVVGHDDFVKVKKDSSTDYNTVYNKDIYMENIGDTPVFVRVKLTEEFSIDGVTQVSAVPHIPTTATESGVTTTDPTVHKTAEGSGDEIHTYFTWDMGITSDTSRNYFLSATSEKYNVDEGLTISDDRVAQDTTQNKYQVEVNAGDATVKRLSVVPVITMTEYQTYDESLKKTFNGWVIDDTTKDAADAQDADGNGWAYWSQRLMKGQATGLLLNGVTVSKALDNKSYTYNIHVDFEAVDKDDEGLWRGTTITGANGEKYEGDAAVEKISKEAAALLDTAASVVPEQITTEIEEMTEKAAAVKDTSAAAAAVYETAIKQVINTNGTVDLSSQFVQDNLRIYKKIAEDIATRKANGDATLNDIVLGVNVDADGKVTSIATEGEKKGKIGAEMDIYVAQYLIDNFDLDDSLTITEEEALAVTNVELNSYQDGQYVADNRISKLDGLTKDNFINIQRYVICRLPKLKTIDERIFYRHDRNEEGAEIIVDGVRSLTFQNCYGLDPCTVDVSGLKDYLYEFILLQCDQDLKIAGFSTLKNLRELILVNPDYNIGVADYITLEDIQTVLDNSTKLEYLRLYANDFKDADNNVHNDMGKLDLSECTNLRVLSVYLMYGTLDVSSNVNLVELELSGKSAEQQLTVDLSNNKAVRKVRLDKVDEEGNSFVTVTGYNGLVM